MARMSTNHYDRYSVALEDHEQLIRDSQKKKRKKKMGEHTDTKIHTYYLVLSR